MTYSRDNTDVGIRLFAGREFDLKLKEYEMWLRERNIKYTLVYIPQWASMPCAINLRNEDALMFKIVFGL